MSAPRVHRFDDLEALSRAAAQLFLEIAQQAVARRSRFTLALAGGSTPKRLYELLASAPLRDQVPWDKVEFFWSDERPVPADHAESNFALAYETLLRNIPVAPAQIHRMPAEREDLEDLEQAAGDYQRELARTFAVQADGEPPMLDLVLLGLGSDGHTASLFPGTTALAERRRWVVANYVPQLQSMRLTLTPPILNHTEHVLFMVSGAAKAQALAAVLEGSRDPLRLPAQLIAPVSGNVQWLVDTAAAGGLRLPHPGPLPQGERVRKEKKGER